jgi:hypothetical protein
MLINNTHDYYFFYQFSILGYMTLEPMLFKGVQARNFRFRCIYLLE